MKVLKAKSYDDFKKGTWQSLAESIAPDDSVKLGLNLDSDIVLGSLVSRPGSTLINAQISDGYPALGLHNHKDVVSGNDVLFAVFSDGTNSDIYDVETGSKSLEDDTKDLKTQFLTYLNATLRLNGTDAPKYFNGTSWLSSPTGANFTAAVSDTITDASHGLIDGDIVIFTTTDTLPAGLATDTNYYVINKTTNTFEVSTTYGGTAVDITDTGTGTHTWAYWDPFDILNIPTGSKYALEFKDKIYIAGSSVNPDRIDISSIVNSVTKTVSWTVDNKFIISEQEDNGGGIRGLAKVPGYILFYKKRTMKRYDGTSAFPEDMINQGAPSQEAIVVTKGMSFSINENGAWVSTGGDPKKISTFSVDSIIKSVSAADLLNAAAGSDGEHVYFSLPSATISNETYTNTVLKYNVLQNSWDVRQYPTTHRAYATFIDSNDEVFTVFGDSDGNVLKLDVGTTDNTTPITYSLETQDYSFGYKLFTKSISQIGFITENISKGTVQWKEGSEGPEDWKGVGTINGPIKLFDKINIRTGTCNIKITETVSTGSATIKSIEFPEGIKVYDSQK